MKPVLLDQRSILKAGMTICAAMLVVFFSGYTIGLHKAEFSSGMGLNKTIALALPRPAHADTSEYEPHEPEAQLPGADIDVDSPEITTAEVGSRKPAAAQADTAETEVETVIQQTTRVIENPATTGGSADEASPQLQMASLAIAHDVPGADSMASVIDGTDVKQQKPAEEQNAKTDFDPAGIFDTASADDARYTIQVGVFADSENAQRRKSALEAQQLSAYVQEYMNKRNETRFNVRFGYFTNKSSALSALNSFEQTMSGSGYVTRIRRN